MSVDLLTHFWFFHFWRGFSFFGNFAYYCVVLLNAPRSDRELLQWGNYFTLEILSHRHWHQEVPLSYWFAVLGGEIISWRGVSWLRTFMSLNLALDFGKNTTTLSEFIGFIDLTDFLQIPPKHSRNNEKRKCVGKFCYLKYSSRGVHLRNTSRMFLATATLDADI